MFNPSWIILVTIPTQFAIELLIVAHESGLTFEDVIGSPWILKSLTWK